jgi:hypothetical protein
MRENLGAAVKISEAAQSHSGLPLESFFLQPPCDAVVDQIFRLQFGELYVGLAEHPQCVLYPRSRRSDTTVVKQTHSFIDVFNVLSWGDYATTSSNYG